MRPINVGKTSANQNESTIIKFVVIISGDLCHNSKALAVIVKITSIY